MSVNQHFTDNYGSMQRIHVNEGFKTSNACCEASAYVYECQLKRFIDKCRFYPNCLDDFRIKEVLKYKVQMWNKFSTILFKEKYDDIIDVNKPEHLMELILNHKVTKEVLAMKKEKKTVTTPEIIAEADRIILEQNDKP